MSDGIDALQGVLRNINTAIKDQELHEARIDLVARVNDWKSHDINAFGNLLLFGVLDINTGGKFDNKKTARPNPSNKQCFTRSSLS
jgi:cell division control protein 24